MNSVDPFASPVIDQETIMKNVSFWRRKNGLNRQNKFRNEPRILKLSGKKIIIDVNPNTGECEVGS